LNANVFHIDHIVYKMVRFLMKNDKGSTLWIIFSDGKNLMKFDDQVPYFYVILTYYVRNEKPYNKNCCVYMCSYMFLNTYQLVIQIYSYFIFKIKIKNITSVAFHLQYINGEVECPFITEGEGSFSI
jgi:hypothetical protein